MGFFAKLGGWLRPVQVVPLDLTYRLDLDEQGRHLGTCEHPLDQDTGRTDLPLLHRPSAYTAGPERRLRTYNRMGKSGTGS